MILDTTFFIDLLRNDSQAAKKVEELEEKNIKIATTTITVFELWQGLRSSEPDKLRILNGIIDSIKVYPLDLQSAKNAGHISNQLKKNGQMIDSEDALIAGIAIEQKEEILTRNIKHFERIPHIKIHSY